VGLKAAGPADRPAPGPVIQQWKSAFGSGPSKMIDSSWPLIPAVSTRANLADRVGMTATGGTFQTYISRLKATGFRGGAQNHAHGDSLERRCRSGSVSHPAHPGQEQVPQI